MLRHLTLAVAFLTGIPVPVGAEVSPAELRRSMGWYPLVGLGLGAAALGLYATMLRVLPGLVAASLVVLVLEGATRGLHMDGLMDTADGVLSGASCERALDIMKDGSVGAMGALAATLVVVLKVAALGSLAPADAAVPLLAGWCVARSLPAFSAFAWPYARAAGTGAAFTRERTPGPATLAAGLALAGGAVAVLTGLAANARDPLAAGAAVTVAAVTVALGVEILVARRLGGLTGDVYGMGIELAETTALVAGCAVVGVAR